MEDQKEWYKDKCFYSFVCVFGYGSMGQESRVNYFSGRKGSLNSVVKKVLYTFNGVRKNVFYIVR